tara:strand:+ start:906 stop:1196 length:291 start_codon:yes stop_codon:yes gene_type:complete
MIARLACPHNAEEHFWHDGCVECSFDDDDIAYLKACEKHKNAMDIAYLKVCEKKGICPESGQPLHPVTYHYPTSTNPDGWMEERCTDASCRCDQMY